MLYPDVESDPPEGFDTSTRHKYQTFITCGVVGAKGRVFGMINVDSQKAGDLTPVDAEVVAFLAEVLGVAFEARELRGRRGPET